MQPTAKWLTPAETAEVLRVKRRTIYRLLERGDLQGRKFGRTWRIPAAEVEPPGHTEKGNGDERTDAPP